MPRNAKEYIKKFVPVDSASSLIYCEVIIYADQHFMLVQDNRFRVSIWKIFQNEVKPSVQLQIESAITVHSYFQSKDEKTWGLQFGCQNGRIWMMEVSAENMSVLNQYSLKVSPQPILYVGCQNLRQSIFIDTSNNFGVYYPAEDKTQTIELAVGIKYAKQFNGYCSSEEPAFLCLFSGSITPYLLPQTKANKFLTEVSAKDIEGINAYYKQEIDNDLQIDVITACQMTSFQCNKYIVIGQSNGKISLFQIEEARVNNFENVPEWYTRNLCLMMEFYGGRSILSLSLFQQNLVYANEEKVNFINLRKRSKLFDSFKQKKQVTLNKLFWSPNEKIIMTGIKCCNSKVYFHEKYLPIDPLENS